MAKKRAKKKAAKRKTTKAKKRVKKAKRKGTVKKAKKAKRPVKKKPKLPAEPIGRVTHYFPKVRAGAFLIERDGVRVGDTLYFKGHTTRFKQKVDSLQIDRQPVTEAGPGAEIGVLVKSRVREHDLVFKL